MTSMVKAKVENGIVPSKDLFVATNAAPISCTTEQIEVRRFEKSLEDFCIDTRLRFEQRFPGIGYSSEVWDFRATKEVDGKKVSLQKLHNTRLTRIVPILVVNDLKALHPSFANAARAVLAQRALENKTKGFESLALGLRLFKHIPSSNDDDSTQRALRTVTLKDLRGIEGAVIESVKSIGLGARQQRKHLQSLFSAVELLQSHDVVTRMNARLSLDANDELGQIAKKQQKLFKNRKAAELEPGIAALSDAIVEMVDDNPVLSMLHKAALCVMGLEMCAPSRVNEIMTLSTKDRLISSEVYDEEPQADESGAELSPTEEALKIRRDLHRAHMEIKNVPEVVLTMKGSKGAAWGPKPILGFMTDLFNECFDRLIQYGKHSRMLVMHYEKHPKKLYLPPSLEHLRGKALVRWQVGQIMLLDPEASYNQSKYTADYVMEALINAGKSFIRQDAPNVVFALDNCTTRADGTTAKVHKDTLYVRWEHIEEELLRRVHEAMDSIRWVTDQVRYEGKLSNMLMLHDGIDRIPPYLPSALEVQNIRKRLKTSNSKSNAPTKTVFELLNITMPVRVIDGKESRGEFDIHKEVVAYVSPHDPRRWLTTQSLRLAGPELSKAVVNKWANRKDISQLDNYDYRAEEEKARQSAAPKPEGMKEFESFSCALCEVTPSGVGLQVEYGLKTRLMNSGTRTVEVTTLGEVRNAVENRPVAKAGGKIIVLYPTEYGVCLHQHHERACTAFNGCGTACNEQTFVKGDLPRNEATKAKAKELHTIIVAQIRPLILAHTRGVAHDPAALEDHIMALIKPHISAEDIASLLIDEFHEYKHFIKDAAFRARLEDAHVFQGVSQMLDSPEVASGALIRYDNPSRHGSPERERSVEALGGRETIAKTIEDFNKSSPWFAPTLMNENELRRLTHVEEDATNDDYSAGDDFEEDEA